MHKDGHEVQSAKITGCVSHEHSVMNLVIHITCSVWMCNSHVSSSHSPFLV